MPTLLEQQQAQREERKREGEAIAWSLLFLASLAAVEQADLQSAAALWTRLAPQAAKGLVGARPMNAPATAFPVTRPASQYRWNQALLRYVAPNGQTVRPAAVKQSVNTFLRDAGDELADLTRRMNAGQISIEEWQSAMARGVKNVHVATEIVAQGGVVQITGDDVKRITKGIDYQLKRLLKFSEELGDLSSFKVRMFEDDEPETAEEVITVITDEAAERRAKLYAETARTTYEESIAKSWGDLAATGVNVQMRNVLAEDADHCKPKGATPGCVQEADRGWVTYGTMSLPGRRVCAMNCQCRVDYRRFAASLEDADATSD